MGEACRFFDTPVTGGNVSFYNESPDPTSSGNAGLRRTSLAVYPTPTIGMIGLVEDLNNITTSYFKDDGDFIYLLGKDNEEIGGSEYLKAIHNKVTGNSPFINLQTEKLLHDSVLLLIKHGLIQSAHDISEGGIAVCLAECCVINEENMIGAEVAIPVKSRKDFSLFSESQSRIIVSVQTKKRKEFEMLLKEFDQPFSYLGKTGGEKLRINDDIEISLDKIAELYYNTIPNIMNREEEDFK